METISIHSIDFITLQEEYYNDLATIGGIENIKPYVLKIYWEVLAIRQTNPHGYRNHRFRVLDDEHYTSTTIEQNTN